MEEEDEGQWGKARTAEDDASGSDTEAGRVSAGRGIGGSGGTERGGERGQGQWRTRPLSADAVEGRVTPALALTSHHASDARHQRDAAPPSPAPHHRIAWSMTAPALPFTTHSTRLSVALSPFHLTASQCPLATG